MKENIDHYGPLLYMAYPPSTLHPVQAAAYYGTVTNGSGTNGWFITSATTGHAMCMYGYSEGVYKVNANARWVIVDTGGDNPSPAWINHDTDFDAYDVEIHPDGVPTTTDPLDTPMGISASDGQFTNKVEVTWQPISGAMTYELWRGPSNTNASFLATVATNQFTDTTLESGNLNYYWIKARYDFDKSHGESQFSIGDLGYVDPGSTKLAIGGTTVADGKRQTMLSVIGRSGLHYRIEVSSNLKDWIPLFSTNWANGVFELSDTTAATMARRFYRGLRSP